jgi:outer membrane protein assembly factor BamB
MNYMTMSKLLCLLSVSLLLGSCSMFSFLGQKKDESLEPNRLSDFTAEVTLRRLWSTNVGNGQGDKKFNRLKPALGGNRVFAASNNGTVMAVEAESGRQVWRQRLRVTLTGGVGYGNGIVVVGSEDSQVAALSADDGTILWQTEVSSEVLSAPATNGRVVVVQTVDGKLTGLDARSGEQVWIYENAVPALTLRGTSAPLIVDNFVLAAFADGSLVSVALDNGTLRWSERVAIPTGRSEIDRLVDVDGDLVVNDNGLLLVPSYQGFLAAIDVVTGQIRWRVEESSEVGASFGFGNVYVVTDQDAVRAYRTSQENSVWENAELRNRKLTAPQGFSNYVAVGDFEGYVHLLAQSDGRFVGRARADRKGIRGRMVSQGNTIYVYGNGGNLVALRIQ